MKLSLLQISKGWTNYATNEPVPEHKIQACENCPQKKHGKLLTFVKDDFKEIEGYYCGVCHCPLSALLRSDEPCKLGKF